jgi:hypothetical protein
LKEIGIISKTSEGVDTCSLIVQNAINSLSTPFKDGDNKKLLSIDTLK